MIVLVANRWDTAARAFASRWASRDVRVLTCQDLSVAGWKQHLKAEHANTAVIEGTPIAQDAITGVLIRLSCVVEDELSHIIPGDREYVAAEMTAFLWFWLSSLNCPVVNPPTAAGLCGPYRQEYWAGIAAGAKIPVDPVRRRAALPSPAQEETGGPPTTVAVVGERVFGETDPALHEHARRLARLAGLELLAVTFSAPERDARLLTADPFPDLADDRFAAAVLERLGSN